MDRLPDLTPIFWLALVGLVAIAVVLLIGVPLFGYWLGSHLQWVP